MQQRTYVDYDIGMFSYDASTKTLTAEASTLGWRPGYKQKYVSVKGKTGKKVFYEHDIDIANPMKSGIAGWKYKPSAKSLQWTPACAGTELTVLNT